MADKGTEHPGRKLLISMEALRDMLDHQVPAHERPGLHAEIEKRHPRAVRKKWAADSWSRSTVDREFRLVQQVMDAFEHAPDYQPDRTRRRLAVAVEALQHTLDETMSRRDQENFYERMNEHTPRSERWRQNVDIWRESGRRLGRA
jgi:hypothetical protein